MLVQLMRNDFGVGLGGKLVARLRLLGPQRLMVFDDAVVHHSHSATANVWVRIALAWRAVCRPASMGDACHSLQLAPGKLLLQLHHPAHCAGPRQLAAGIEHNRASRIVAAIFETLEALDQCGHHIPLRYGADNTAHISNP